VYRRVRSHGFILARYACESGSMSPRGQKAFRQKTSDLSSREKLTDCPGARTRDRAVFFLTGSPESNPIEIADLSKRRDEERLLHVMGSEAANVHLGSRHAVANILKDMRRRKANWLRSAARDMAKATERDWKKYLEA